ncbi:MAG: hypothetical protein Q8P67_27355, partial [archaeon]|nr:hypothetical protein [archaeon]
CLSEYFVGRPSVGSAPAATRKAVLIMDEVDGMSGGDRGGMVELIGMIKKTSVPIICICNDRQAQKIRSLKNYCLDLSWRRPTAQQMASRLASIAHHEGLNISPPDMVKICEAAHGDVRQALNILQVWALQHSAGSFTGTPLQDRLKEIEKAVDLTLFEVTPKLFQFDRYSLEEKFQFYHTDQLVPLMVQENYLSVVPNVARHPQLVRMPRALAEIKLISEAALSISDGDLIDAVLMGTQSWSLSQPHGVCSTLRTSFFMQGALSDKLSFPGWLSKYGPTQKHNSWLRGIAYNMRSSPSACFDFLPALRSALSQPLITQGVGGVDLVFDTLTSYHLNREDFDAVFELTDLGLTPDPLKSIPSSVKANFTRRWNKEHAKLGHVPLKRSAPKPSAQELGVELDDAAEDADAEQSDPEDLDQMIILKKNKA